MILDTTTQQQFLLELLKHATYPGHLIELAYETQKAIRDATVLEEPVNMEELKRK